MLSRYCLTSSPDEVRACFSFRNAVDFPPRYNIAPSQPVLIVRHDHKREREIVLVRWGLIPSWVKEPKDPSLLIHARSETAAEKPSFRGAMRHKRCLVPANGFYVWTGKPGTKQPHLIASKSGGPIALAGLWEHWLGADGSEIETALFLTVPANREVARIHARMPVILARQDFDRWLNCSSGRVDDVLPLLVPAQDGALSIRPVSRRLNNARNEGPDLHLQDDDNQLL